MAERKNFKTETAVYSGIRKLGSRQPNRVVVQLGELLIEIWPHGTREKLHRAATKSYDANPQTSITCGINRPHCIYDGRQVHCLFLVGIAKAAKSHLLIANNDQFRSWRLFYVLNPWRIMKKSEVLRFRAEPQHEAKILRIREATGLKTSVILRKMIEYFDPADAPSLPQNAESSVTTRQGSHAAFPA